MKRTAANRVRLVKSVALNPEVKHFVWEVLGRSSFDFEPGQHVCLTKGFEGETIDRYYSIASAPNGTNRFELCLNTVRDRSPLGRYLSRMKPGDEVDFRGPAGNFRLRQPVRDAVFLATGTGITPMRSMLKYLLGGERGRSGEARLTLLFGARDPRWLFYRDEFEELERRHAGFRFWPTLSGAPDGWKGRRGYVQAHLDEALEGRTEGIDIYLCGRGAMIQEVCRRLREAGFDEDAVVYEKYG